LRLPRKNRLSPPDADGGGNTRMTSNPGEALGRRALLRNPQNEGPDVAESSQKSPLLLGKGQDTGAGLLHTSSSIYNLSD